MARRILTTCIMAHTAWSSQSIKICNDFSIDKSIKIGKSDLIDLIDIDCIDQSVEIDDTLPSFGDLSWFLPISYIYLGRNIYSSVHWIHANSKLLTIVEWQLRVKWSNVYHYAVLQTLSLIKKYLKNLIFSLKPGLKSSSDGLYWPGL